MKIETKCPHPKKQLYLRIIKIWPLKPLLKSYPSISDLALYCFFKASESANFNLYVSEAVNILLNSGMRMEKKTDKIFIILILVRNLATSVCTSRRVATTFSSEHLIF